MKSFEISKKFYDLFFTGQKIISLREYLDGSYCDESALIDLKTNSFKSIYHTESKYFVPVTDGTFHSLYIYTVKNGVHPEDLKEYIDLMDPHQMMERQKNSPTPNFRFSQFRYKLANGSYRWVEQCILSGKENGLEDNQFLLYIFDIENMKNRELGFKSSAQDQFSLTNINPITGVLNENAFFYFAQKLLKSKKLDNPCLLAIDIDHFKFFDEWYGRDKGDELLKNVGALLKQYSEEYKGYSGYIGQDDFVLIMPYDMDVFRQIFNEIRAEIVNFGFSFGFNPAIGVARLSEDDDCQYAFDRASIAGTLAKKSSRQRIVVYDPQLHMKTENEFKIITDFMRAIKNNEVVFYLQPQCRISTNKVVGAEALTRWVKKSGEIIAPGEFIPVLEKYGFITDLDKYIWESVCKWLREWIDAGHKPVSISLNVSQVDIFNIDVVELFEQLIAKYKLPANLLKLEITESTFGEDLVRVTEVVNKLRNDGFLVLMDDFGSGYSSLNMLSDLSFDIVKLDAKFLRENKNDAIYKKNIQILESVINLSKLIAVPLIVEGVEKKEQVDFLEGLGCRYVQGYYFYRPMPVKQFEELIEDGKMIDERGFVVKLNQQFRMREFLDQNIYSDSMLNNVIGAVAIYSYDGKSIDIVRYNQQFYETVGVTEFQERLKDIQNFVPEHLQSDFYRLLDEAKINKLQGSSGALRFYRPDGSLMTFLMHFYYLGEQDGTSRYYGSASNMTDYTNLQQQMRLIAEFSPNTVVFFKKSDKYYLGLEFSVAIHGLADAMGISRERFEEELNNGGFYKRIEKEELDLIWKHIQEAIANKKTYAMSFTMRRDDGKLVEIALKGNPIYDPITGYDYIVSFRQKYDKEIN